MWLGTVPLRRVLLEAPRDAWTLPSDGRPVEIRHCALPIPSAYEVPVMLALARLLGAELAMHSGGSQPGVLVVTPTPTLLPWLGPGHLVDRLAPLADRTLANIAGAYIHFSRGLVAVQRGFLDVYKRQPHTVADLWVKPTDQGKAAK